ncbi:hypothetical protein JCM3774_000633 [Rhodotorula dairenensis]
MAAAPDAALRPLTLRSLSPELAHISSLKATLAHNRQLIHGYARLQGKLESFTDEPVWDALIPFGPLAFFPGQLVHTNDIVQPGHHPEPARDQPDGSGILRSAKQARQEADRLRQALEQEVAALEREIAQKEEALRQARHDERRRADKGKGKALDLVAGDLGAEEDWTINERGEVINEEGLPMFDIREDLPAEPVVSTSASTDQSVDEPSSVAPPTRRFLIKKGGKQTVGMLKPTKKSTSSPSTTPARPPSSTLSALPRGAAGTGAPNTFAPSDDSVAEGENPIPARPRLDIKAILDELEAEEQRADEASASLGEAEADAETAAPGEADGIGKPDETNASSSGPTSSSSTSGSSAAAATAAASRAETSSTTTSSTGFAGFAPGFLSKSKQKKPSNSLNSAAATTPAEATKPANPLHLPPTVASAVGTTTTPGGRPLKPALSRPVSPSRATASGRSTPLEKKRVAFDLPSPSAEEEETSSRKPASQPIILGMGDATPGFGVETISSDEFKANAATAAEAATAKGNGRQEEEEEEKSVFVRPIRDTVVEKPLRKPVPPSPSPLKHTMTATATGAPAAAREKRVSRFKRMKEEALSTTPAATDENPPAVAGAIPTPCSPTSTGKQATGESRRPQPEWSGPPEIVSTAPEPPAAASSSTTAEPVSSSPPPPGSAAPDIPTPVHTISFKAPTADWPVPEGTVSYADIPDDSNDEADDDDGDDNDDEEPYIGDSDDDEFGYSDGEYGDDDDEIDEAELDVDAALHAREVALAYHQQRLNLGGGRGTGALGGYHEIGQSPFGNVGRDNEAVVSADATLQSLDPEIATNAFGSYSHAGSAQLGKGSRFRNATRHLESAQLIIPSLLAADPTFTTSKEPLGPAPAGVDDDGVDDDGLDATERERLRQTLEAIVEGRPLPEDQQQYERQREIFLREELAHEKEERDRERRERERTAGKRPPELVQRIVPQKQAATEESAPEGAHSGGPTPVASRVVEKPSSGPPLPEKADQQVTADSVPPTDAPVEPEPPKRMSRFRQKQLGLID